MRVQDMSRGGWIVIGIIVALLLVPSGVAVARALRYTGIEGTSLNKADVTPAGQLQVAPAPAGAFFQSGESIPMTSGYDVVALAPSPFALVVTTLHIDTYADPTPGAGQLDVFVVETGTSCTGSFVGNFTQVVNPGAIGETEISVTPGLGVPAGDALCADAAGSLEVENSVSGYTVPSAAVPAASAHGAAKLPQQQH